MKRLQSVKEPALDSTVFLVNLSNKTFDKNFGIYKGKHENGRAKVFIAGKEVLIKPENCLLYETDPVVDPSWIIWCLRRGIADVSDMISARADIKHRVDQVTSTFKLNTSSPQFVASARFQCLDMGPPQPNDQMYFMMKAMIPECIGDRIVDFNRFGHGISYPKDDEDFKGDVLKRIKEYLLSGMCEKCQVKMFECGDYLVEY
ncbi:hypothetical protein MIR68_000290 [Amoeboaphelidium protococcarum]|nr:hypothetical protein MIR68_000290 [Amoeboaphelidium protococcarum]